MWVFIHTLYYLKNAAHGRVQAEYRRLEYRVFPLLDSLQYQGLSIQSAPQFTPSWENRLFHDLLEGIKATEKRK